MTMRRATKILNLNVNGEDEEIEIFPYESLNHLLRERMGLTGTKRGCDFGGCGSCSVVLNGNIVYSCMTPAMKAQGGNVLTIEYLSKGGSLHNIQKSFIENDGLQCGYCTPGFIMTTFSLLSKNSHPTDEEIKEAVSGNICRCTGYGKILMSIKSASESMQRLS